MGHPVGECGARAGGGGRVANNPPYNMNSKLKLLLSETKNGYTLPAKIYPTVCVCHSLVLASPPLPSPNSSLALLRWVCCRAMDDKDNLLSCLSPRVQLDWQFRLQRTPGLAQISLFRLPTISSPTFSWQLPDCHHKQSVVRILVSQSPKERSCISYNVGHKDRAKIFQIIAMMCLGLKLVLKKVKRPSWTYSNAKCEVLLQSEGLL